MSRPSHPWWLRSERMPEVVSQGDTPAGPDQPSQGPGPWQPIDDQPLPYPNAPPPSPASSNPISWAQPQPLQPLQPQLQLWQPSPELQGQGQESLSSTIGQQHKLPTGRHHHISLPPTKSNRLQLSHAGTNHGARFSFQSQVTVFVLMSRPLHRNQFPYFPRKGKIHATPSPLENWGGSPHWNISNFVLSFPRSVVASFK